MLPTILEPAVRSSVRLDERHGVSNAPTSGWTTINEPSATHNLKLSRNDAGHPCSLAEPEFEPDRPPDGRALSEHPDCPDPSEMGACIPSAPNYKHPLLSYNNEEDGNVGLYLSHPLCDIQRALMSSSHDRKEEKDDADKEEPIVNDIQEPLTQRQDLASLSQTQAQPCEGNGGDHRRWHGKQDDTSRTGCQHVFQQRHDCINPSEEGNLSKGPNLDSSNNSHDGNTESAHAAVQGNLKRRKRDFCNRTKTGCLTCRQRKKKCDEAKPECNNCISRGLYCMGYPMKRIWTKPGKPEIHPPLRPKHGCPGHPNIHTSLATAPTSELFKEVQNCSSTNPCLYGQSVPTAMATSLHQPWAFGTLQTTSTAQLAQQQHQSLTTQHVPQLQQYGPHSEKDRMLSGDYFYPLSRQLLEEQEQCRAALWEFNRASRNGAGRDEQTRLLRYILEPPDRRQSMENSTLLGRLGKDVHINAPFHCDYGYNLIIGDGVIVGPRCTIINARRVYIGSGSILGPNVKIYTIDYSESLQDRKSSKMLVRAEEVRIEEDVVIGGNVTILPGAVVGRGSVVGAGSIVRKSVCR